MDPKAALDFAARLIGSGDYDEAYEQLGVYYRWRLNGGFEPEGGDETADSLRASLFDDDGDYLGEY